MSTKSGPGWPSGWAVGEVKTDNPVKCPGCEVFMDEADMLGQAEHMLANHPEIIAERMKEDARLDGWVNDG